ncbi:hypothetical protein CO046_00425 [Candidatus Peregrinibacteria bacterium CG_4_9_14_0_2_um_filter_53_11]|nr:MAG: hypothetical protein CO046_00425 [Candidatus Peregrinibacteria bacterium CG_4_9_14_0_2_um_filter_53_11]
MNDTKKIPNEGGKKRFGELLISWESHEHKHKEKSSRWFISAVVVLALMVAFDLYNGGWSFSIALLLFAGTYYLAHRHSEQVTPVAISTAGVMVGPQLLPYNALKCFWIFNAQPHVQRLYLRMESRVRPDLYVEIGSEVTPEEVRQVLRPHLKELKGMEEPFADTLVRLFKL